jgi:hypothetical protein
MFRQQHSLSLLRSPHRPAPFAATSYTRSEDRSLSPQKAGAVAGRPTACTTVKGASGRRPRRQPKQTPLCPLPLGLGTVLRAVAMATTPPLILLLVRARLVESPRQDKN